MVAGVDGLVGYGEGRGLRRWWRIGGAVGRCVEGRWQAWATEVAPSG